MKHPLPIFMESPNKQRSVDYSVHIRTLSAEGHEGFHCQHNNDVHLCYHIKPPGTPTKAILTHIPCHNSPHQDPLASIGFNSALIQKLSVAPKLCYLNPCFPALRITFNALQMMSNAICLSNSRFFSLSV